MELFRAEYEAKLPPNWGAKTFQRILKREATERSLPPKEVSAKVQLALKNPHIVNEENVLNITNLLNELTSDEMCEYFSTLQTRCTVLIMQSWKNVNDKVLRCISMKMGEYLEELDLSYSQATLPQLEILLARVTGLKILRICGCPFFDAGCMGIVTKVSSEAVVELYADTCPLFRIDPLLIVGGCIGFHAPKLSNITVLSLASCPMEDKGLLGVKSACRKIQFLNLCDNAKITDESVAALVKANKHLEVVNLSNCLLLTSVTVSAMAKHCPRLTSVNLSKCLKVTDKGVVPLITNCDELVALNLAGLRKLTETVICTIALHATNMVTLNITGCEQITTNGLTNLIAGFPYVQQSMDYIGFKPIDNYLELKLQDQLNGIRVSHVNTIKRFYKSRHSVWAVKADYQFERMTQSAEIIQRAVRGYLRRLPFHHMAVNRRNLMSLELLQRVYRGYRGRCIAFAKRAIHAEFLRLYPYALKLQKVARGHKCRRKHRYVATAIRNMYRSRLSEAIVAISVRFQSCGRRFLARKKAEAWKEVRTRRMLDEFNAILLLQCLGRSYNARTKVAKLRAEKARLDDLIYRSSTRIQKWMVKCTKRHRQKMTGEDRKRIYKKEWAATLMLQKVYRGYRGREKWNKARIRRAREHYAASQIQRIYRGCCILQYKDLRLNIISAYVLDRHYVERQDSIAASRNRYRMFLEDVKRDSASEPDEEEEEPPQWLKQYDKARQKYYWFNPMTNETTFDEPKGHLVHERAMIYKRVKVFWVVQGMWYEGSITNYHLRKQRHRIQYDDGDHEWLNLSAEYDRIQVQEEDGTWVMYNMYKAPEVLAEMQKETNKIAEDAYKAQAWRDAEQWKIIPADNSLTILFMSEISGEFRTGVLNADHWLIQDDGYGYPCFYNIDTEEVLHEDPRFEPDSSADLAAQRAYVMNELRFAMYFIRDLYTKYEDAVAAEDKIATNYYMAKIRESPKIKHLNAFLIRAKGLYVQQSVVDKPMHTEIEEEIKYAAWISERVAEIIDKAELRERANLDLKKAMVAKFRKGASEKMYCKHCKNETKRHLEFCPTCGRRQL